MTKHIYMAVTNDRFELPCFVGTAKEVAEFLECPLMTVYTSAERETVSCGKYNVRRVSEISESIK